MILWDVTVYCNGNHYLNCFAPNEKAARFNMISMCNALFQGGWRIAEVKPRIDD